LVKRIGANAAALQKGGLGNPAPDLLYSSGSGLDPHISPTAAAQQLERVAANRHLRAQQLRQLIQRHTEGRSLGLLGEARVNVLELNLDLDRLSR
jgi:K+-transporting ATPase ATPase C chain